MQVAENLEPQLRIRKEGCWATTCFFFRCVCRIEGLSAKHKRPLLVHKSFTSIPCSFCDGLVSPIYIYIYIYIYRHIHTHINYESSALEAKSAPKYLFQKGQNSSRNFKVCRSGRQHLNVVTSSAMSFQWCMKLRFRAWDGL